MVAYRVAPQSFFGARVYGPKESQPLVWGQPGLHVGWYDHPRVEREGVEEGVHVVAHGVAFSAAAVLHIRHDGPRSHGSSVWI